jgi:hypothetical protein
MEVNNENMKIAIIVKVAARASGIGSPLMRETA